MIRYSVIAQNDTMTHSRVRIDPAVWASATRRSFVYRVSDVNIIITRIHVSCIRARRGGKGRPVDSGFPGKPNVTGTCSLPNTVLSFFTESMPPNRSLSCARGSERVRPSVVRQYVRRVRNLGSPDRVVVADVWRTGDDERPNRLRDATFSSRSRPSRVGE